MGRADAPALRPARTRTMQYIWLIPLLPGLGAAINGILNLMIENDWLDHEFIEQSTVGFDAVAEVRKSVKHHAVVSVPYVNGAVRRGEMRRVGRWAEPAVHLALNMQRRVETRQQRPEATAAAPPSSSCRRQKHAIAVRHGMTRSAGSTR